MALGHLDRCIFQLINIWYFAIPGGNGSKLTIWLMLPFGSLTCLPPIGFTMFTFRYFEATSLTLILKALGSKEEQDKSKGMINFWKWTAIIILAVGVTL